MEELEGILDLDVIHCDIRVRVHTDLCFLLTEDCWAGYPRQEGRRQR